MGPTVDQENPAWAARADSRPGLPMVRGELVTCHVRGTNNCRIAVYPDRVKGRVVVIAVIDNLVKGSSGQAIQNFNLMMGWNETLGLSGLQALFP